MVCQECGKETGKGKFCQFCGASQDDEVAPAEQKTEPEQEATEEANDPQTQPAQEAEPNKYVELLKEESSKLGGFLLQHLKKPRDAKNITGESYISGIVTIVIFTLIITLNQYFNAESLSSYLSGDPTFFDDFFVPWIKYLILFGLLAVIIFGAAKAVLQELAIKETFAKYGAYLVPFILLYLVGILLSLVNLTLFGLLAVTFSLIGIIMIIPTLMLTEQDVKGFDLVYTVIVVSLVSMVVYGYLSTDMFTEVLKLV